MNLFQNKYRVESARLQDYDYSSPGFYFVTICTKDRQPYLGLIHENEMRLSQVGRIAEDLWQKIPEHFSNVKLDEYVIMPNYVHAIICIGENPKRVETQHAASLRPETNAKPRRPDRLLPGSLPVIIRSYKSAVKKSASTMRIDFAWQARFHDHVIRDEDALLRIREYINMNPMNWENDDLFTR